MPVEPTTEQLEILAQFANKPVTVISAGPGCAKSTTLAMCAKTIPRANWPSSLGLTFNSAAAKELQTKFPSSIGCVTLNSLGHSLLNRMFDAQPRLNVRKSREILDEIADSGRWSIAPEEREDLLRLITFAKSQGYVPPRSATIPFRGAPTFAELCQIAELRPESHWESLLNQALKLSIERATTAREIDFDDQIYLSALFATNLPRFSFVFVDEAQDLSPIQLHLISRLRAEHLVLVGDPKQAIYGFRGAMTDSFDRINALWPNAAHFPLQTSFRTPRSHLPRLQLHCPSLKTHSAVPGSFHTITQPTTIDALLSAFPARSVAFLCRNNAPLYKVALACLAEGLPFNIANSSFGTSLIRDIERFRSPYLAAYAIPNELRRTLPDETFRERDLKADKIAVVTKLIQRLPSTASAADLLKTIKSLLHQSNTSTSRPPIFLATAHRAKGMEFELVFHLDPNLIPSPLATAPEELAQEANIDYVIHSRSKDVLVHLSSDLLRIDGSAPIRPSKRPNTKGRQPL